MKDPTLKSEAATCSCREAAKRNSQPCARLGFARCEQAYLHPAQRLYSAS